MDTKRSRLGMDPLSWILDDEGSSRMGPRPRPRPVDTTHSDILELRDKPLSRVVANYLSCVACGAAVRDTDGEKRPSCPRCQKEVTEAAFFFKRPIHSLVDLTQTAFHLGRAQTGEKIPVSAVSGLDQAIACLLFFTRLGDAALDQLIRSILRAQRLPPHICKRLLADHTDYRSRIGKLFPSLTGKSWRGSVEELAGTGEEYIETLVFRQRASTVLEAFFQLGEPPEKRDELSATCVLRVGPLLQLHAEIHNVFVVSQSTRIGP